MACMKLGSKPDVFQLDGHSWFCSTGLPSDVTVEVGDTVFHLHKFPLLSRSGYLETIISEFGTNNNSSGGEACTLQLHDIPGGARVFALVAKFCYGVRIELTASNIVSVRCAAEYLNMSEDYGEGNLVIHAEAFLNEIFASWADSLKVLETSEEVMSYAEDLHVVSRCLNSLALKACAADPSLFNLPVSHSPEGISSSGGGTMLWNGICTSASAAKGNPGGGSEDWWFEDVSMLTLPLYKRLVLAVESRGMKPEKISGSLMHYAKKNLCLLGRDSSSGDNRASGSSVFTSPQDSEQRNLLEEITGLLPLQKGVTPTNFLLRLLRTSMVLQCNPLCRESLEKRVGAQLDQAVLEDLLIPSLEYTTDTLYDIDCVQRILDHFMVLERNTSESASNYMLDESQIMGGSQPLTPISMVANLMDGFLAEVAPDPNLKLDKFQSLAAVIPEYARPLDDGLYRAIDIFLKAHQWLTDSEREQVCRLMNCQKLSLEASTHAAQNERLPLRVIVQVLFFEQLRLRTSVAGWFFVSDNLETLQNHSGNLTLAAPPTNAANIRPRSQQIVAADTMRDRVSVLERECFTMKEELDKIVKTKGSWNLFLRRIGFRLKLRPCDGKLPPKSCSNAREQPLVDATMDNPNNTAQV